MDEERESASVAVPPGETVAEERARLAWARRLLNGNRRATRSIEPLKGTVLFIDQVSPGISWVLVANDKASLGKPATSSLKETDLGADVVKSTVYHQRG